MKSRFIHKISTILHSIILLSFALLCCHCGVQQELAEDQFLYGETQITLETPNHFDNQKRTRSDLKELVFPKKPAKGEAPAIFDTSDITQTILVMEDYLFDKGYFQSSVSFDTNHDDRHIGVDYSISSPGRYKIRNVFWPEDSTGLQALILRNKDKALVRSGNPYQASDLIGERLRLEGIARNQGYYLFNESDLYYFVDTTAHGPARDSDVWIKVNSPGDSLRHRQFYIGQTQVYPNYSLIQSNRDLFPDTIYYKGLNIYQDLRTIRPEVLRQSIKQSKGELFKSDRQDVTINHLLDLGIFKFVNQDFEIAFQQDTPILNRFIYLTPGLMQDISGSFDISTRGSNFRFGLNANYVHKNIFGGAEKLDLKLGTAFESGGQILLSDETFPNDLYEISGQASLTFPRFIIPFFSIENSSSYFIPKTRLSLFSSFQRRKELFTLLNMRLSYGFDWQETRKKRHALTPININLVNVSNISAAFEDFLESEPRLKSSFENLFIFGPSYRYTYTNQNINVRRNYTFFQGQVEAAGNLIYLLSSVFDNNGDRPYNLFGREFSQFFRMELDFRYNVVGKNNQFVFRMAPAIVVPYSNSEFVPYTKQYYVGGPNSMRAFPNRGLLGSFIPEEAENVSVSYFDQTGDFKFETNLEYRYNLLSSLFLKGALFMDIGNVWLLASDSTTDERKVLDANEFFEELAVGIGTGFRVDLPFMVFRFDLSIPLKKPFLERGNRWVWNESGFINGPWIWKNMSLQIAVGYPF